MTSGDRLQVIAGRLGRDTDDPRQALLDVLRELLSLCERLQNFPKRLRDEVAEIRRELEAVQPRFPSYPQTSVLYDREGMGQVGRERARHLASRIIAVAKAVETSKDRPRKDS